MTRKTCDSMCAVDPSLCCKGTVPPASEPHYRAIHEPGCAFRLAGAPHPCTCVPPASDVAGGTRQEQTDLGWTKKDQQQEPTLKGESSMSHNPEMPSIAQMRPCPDCGLREPPSEGGEDMYCECPALLEEWEPTDNEPHPARDLPAARLAEEIGWIAEGFVDTDLAHDDPVRAVRIMAEMLRAAQDSLAGDSVPAVDPSRSTPNEALPASVRPVEGDDADRLEYLRERENEAIGTVSGDPAFPTLDSFREAVDSLRRMRRAPLSARPTPETPNAE